MIKKSSLAALLVLFAVCAVNAQTTGLSGHISDSETREPIPFANIIVQDSTKVSFGAASDIDGNYSIILPHAGRYKVKVSFLGYRPAEITGVEVKNGKFSTQDFSLLSTAVSVEGVTITKYRTPLIDKDKTVSGYTVTSEEIRSSVVATKVGGVSTRSSRDESAKIEEKSLSDVADWSKPDPGQLTASELNDFSKWDLWQDIRKKDLKKFKSVWDISPESRYSVQVRAVDGQPVTDAVVLLKGPAGEVIWSAKTDNTGKAELWSNLFKNPDKGKGELSVVYGNEEYPYGKPNLISKGINTLIIPVACNNPDTVDIAFVVDATGSMSDEMNYLKAELLDIINDQKAMNKTLAFNTGSVFYRDLGDDYVTRKSGFSNDLTTTVTFIANQQASGGGDYPESVDEGLKEAIGNMDWSTKARARILFLLLDAPPHTGDEVNDKLQKYIRMAAQKGIRIVPIIASGETSEQGASLEYLMRSIALATNGTYVFLTDHSKIGNTHAKPVTDQYDVELLNNLLKRLIVQYTFIPDCGENRAVKQISDTSYFTNSPVIAHEILDLSRTRTPYVPAEIIKDFTQQTNADSSNTAGLTDSIAVPLEGEPTQPIEPFEIKYYPNPTSGLITLEIQGQVNEVFLTDISGKLIEKINAKGESVLKVDLSNYSSGIYFLKCFAQNKSFTGKVLLRR